jgi:ankyrin repeat protein
MLMFSCFYYLLLTSRSTAIDYLETYFQRQNVAITYIYFDYKDRENQTATRVVCALLKQVVSQLETIPPLVEKLFEESIRRASFPDLPTLWGHLISCLCLFESVYVVLDALDECEENQQRDILNLVDELLTQPSIQIMVTSRPHLQKIKQLTRPSLCIDITADKHDIRAYVYSRCEMRFWKPSVKGQRECTWLHPRLIDFRFLLVEFQLHYVLSKKEPRRVEAAIRARSLPKQIHEAYEEVLERIERESCYGLVVKILSWVFHARRPLSMDELREALSIDSGDSRLNSFYFLEPSAIVEVCKSLVTYDESNGIVRFTHYTVQDYLQTKRPEILLNVVELAKTLLTYLSFDIFKEPWSGVKELKERIKEHKLSGYASHSWSDYARGNGENDSELQRLLFQVFESKQHIKTLFQLETMGEELSRESRLTLLHFATRHQLESICRMVAGLEDAHNVNHMSIVRLRKEEDVFMLPIKCDVRSNSMGNVHSRDQHDRTPLHVAAEIGSRNIVELLLEAGADINVKSVYEGDLTPLHLAVYYGHDNVVATLIDAGADMEVKWGYRGETPLLLAARLGRVEMIEKLLQKSANIAANIEGVRESAVMQAIHASNVIEVAELLLRAGADPNAMDVEGRTALHYALLLCPVKECIQLLERLLGAGANPNIPSLDGCTPLHTAAYIDLQDRLHNSNLRKLRAKFSNDSMNEVYAYRCAVQETLLPRRADVEGEGAIAEIVKLLLVCGADGTCRNLAGDTPLQCAIKSRNEEAAFALFWDIGGQVEFTMDRLGDQEFLNKIRNLWDEMRGSSLNNL